MSSRALMGAAMRREATPRIPCMPQICYDTPVRIYAKEDGLDWIGGVARCLEDPSLVYDYVIRLVEDVDCDGLRLFVRADSLTVRREGDSLVVVDPLTGDRRGKVDLDGGGYLVPDLPVPPIDSLEDVGRRCQQAERGFSDDKMALLEQARARVPQRFVASSPIGITMDSYSDWRGREQSLIDLIERPDFVAAAFDMLAETAIRQAEKLLACGIDGLYIGDPAASASLISPQHFEKLCVPAYQKFCRHFRDREVLIYIHVCGNSNPILEMLADTGAHTVEPLDPLGGVSVADAKRRIGRRVALMGGVNTLTLANGTPDQVRAEAIQKCREGGPHGYVLAAGDMVPPITSLENLSAMVDVAKDSLWR
ncbi:MAG: uroporphyrinogen decarboxylase family protein [Candidatus Latescibacterota bacterium]